mmetsp:Transcript_5130/g.7093  ORF Transcript_5130/g.7093 Transcript_5130/m.7093 type:complete len:401 (-) Transcript_5130:36-1238(-)
MNSFDEPEPVFSGWTSDDGSTDSSSSGILDCTPTEEEERIYIPGRFEGPEKTLEICFNSNTGGIEGCRAFSRRQLDDICTQARCTILSQISNAYLDAYVLSESSLFVYPHKFVIKTCGTTTLLRCIERVLKFAADQGLELEWLGYSRKNYTFPDGQPFPHSNFEQELNYINSHSSLSARLDGSGYTLGPTTGDHWLVYVADKCNRPSYLSTDRVLNIMMFDMDKRCAEMFYKENCPSGKEMTEKTGISALVPGAVIDDCAFEPCGYSMNAILFDSYATMHVTPEEECSYASFETNQCLRSYNSLIKNVISIFKPKRFVITMWADEAGLITLQENPCSLKKFQIPNKGEYVRTTACSAQFEGDTCCYMSNWSLVSEASRSSKYRSYYASTPNPPARKQTFS